MSQRSTYALLAIVAALAAFIYFYERETVASSELEEREGRFVPTFSRERLTRIVVERGGERVEITRSASDAGVESFRLTKPVEGAVDETAVDDLVSGIEWAEPLREVGAANADERRRFGLDRPRVRVTLVSGRDRVVLAFGAEEPTGRGVYATRSTDEDVVFVVGKDVFDAVDREASQFRDRRLAPEGLGDATRVSVRTPADVTTVVASDGVWWTESGPRMHASRSRVEALVEALTSLTATQFAPPALAASAAGLEAPFATIEGRFAEVRVLVVIGGTCEGGRYVRVDRGPIACVDDAQVTALVPPAGALVERRLIAVANDEVKGLTLTDGTRTLVITETDGRFRYRLTGDGAEQSGDVDATVLADHLDALRALEGTAAPASPATYGGKLTIERREGPSEVVDLAFGPQVIARRAGDAAAFVLPAAAGAALVPSALPFQRRILLTETPEHLTEITVVRAGKREVVRPGEGPGTFRVTAPIEAPADTERAAALWVRLAGLEAMRFVATAPAAEHGLTGSGAFEVTMRFGGEDDGHGHDHGAAAQDTTRTLVVGAATTDGAFARLDDGPVFVLPQVTAELLREPLVARDLLATNATFVDGVAIDGGVAIRREGAGFVSATGAVDPAVAMRLVDAIAALEAVAVVGYDARGSGAFATPRARITVTRGTEAPAPSRYVVVVGAEAEDGRTHVRREDLAIDFLVRSDVVAPLLPSQGAPR